MENPSAYIPSDRRRALAQGDPLPERSEGAVLFADISGFTPLTEAFAHFYGPRRGIDEFAQILNRVYNALITQIHRHGGSVIGFSGDAITCWFGQTPALQNSVCQAVAAGLAVQQAIQDFARLTIGQEPYPLGLKVAISGGTVGRFVVGDPAIQLFDVLTGSVLRRIDELEKETLQGDVLLDARLARTMTDRVSGSWRTEPSSPFAVTEVHHPLPAPLIDADLPDLPLAVAQQWLLPALYERIQGEQSRFLAELRPATALFLNFNGIDYDRDAAAGQKLNDFFQQVQRTVHRYEGALIQLTTGDKGSYLYAGFGAPVAHGDDVRRAVAVAQELRDVSQKFPYIQEVRMGISQGRMRTGAYGSDHRRTYGILGDEVNLAARLMGRAQPGQIVISPRVAEAVAPQYRLHPLGEASLKGKRQPIPLFAVEAEQRDITQQISNFFAQPLVGRSGEQEQFAQILAQVESEGGGQIVRLIGEAGVGKSHLAATWVAQAWNRGVQVAVGSCQSTQQDVAYAAARQIARQLLGLPPGGTVADQIMIVSGLISGMNPAWRLRLPLLGDLLDLPIPDTETTAAFSAQLRQDALTSLVVEIVRSRASQQPLLLLFEDIHWIDEASRLLLLSLARAISDVPILLLLIHRPLGSGDESFAQQLESLPSQQSMALGELDESGVAALVGQRLGGEISPLALSLIQAQGQGNPFFTEELVDALLEGGDLVQRQYQIQSRSQIQNQPQLVWTLSQRMERALEEADVIDHPSPGAGLQQDQRRLRPGLTLASVSLGLPDSIHGLVLSRLDRLPEPVKLTLKVASVIGRVFDADLLIQAHPGQIREETLLAQLETLSQREFARLERPHPQLAYIFKHNITQEVVYRTLLESQQQALHLSVAQELERMQPNAVEQLAFHYRHGDLAQPDVRRKAVDYLEAAGEKAKREYANETALGHFNRALGLQNRWEWLDAKIEVLHILGRRDQERETLERLSTHPDAPAFEKAYRWGSFFEALSDYEQARPALEQALAAAKAAGDLPQTLQALSQLGMVHWRQGAYDEATRLYHQALEQLSQTDQHPEEEARIRYGLGLLHRDHSRYDEARQEFERVLVLTRRTEDRQSEAKTLAALAGIHFLHDRDYEQAAAYVEESLIIRRTIGDRNGEGSSLLNLAQVLNRMGDYSRAEELLQEALTIQQTLGNRWWEAIVWNELGVIHLLLGAYEQAEQAATRAIELSQSIGADQFLASCLGNLGQILRERGEYEQAENVLQEAYDLAVAQNEHYLRANHLSEMVVLYLQMGEWQQAIQSGEDALALLAESAVSAAQTADLTALALAHLNAGHAEQAQNAASRAFDLLERSDGEGADFPHRDYYRCYQVFSQIAGEETAKQARRALDRAHDLLLAQSQRISNPARRQTYLQNVSFNRAILQAVAQEERTETLHS